MLLYHHSDFALHDTKSHPESVARITHLNQMLRDSGWLDRCALPTWKGAVAEQCERNHSVGYLKELEDWCKRNAGRVEVDTVVSTGSWHAATLAAGAVCDAVQRVIAQEDTRAFCAIRPPGHHAMPQSAMGFCLLNNVAIGALHARSLGLNRVLIIDWDVHHGNGTQATFWEDPSVGFVSIHRFPFYPGTGKVEETGSGRGLGTKVNIPVSASIAPDEFLKRLFDATEKLANQLKPELILVSAGFDAHRFDPVGGLTLEAEHYHAAGKWVSQLARQHCGGNLVSILEGGYHLEHMPACVHAHLEGIENDSPPIGQPSHR
jgi:acetoin utilization deacetylase AcuC-like enzyme